MSAVVKTPLRVSVSTWALHPLIRTCAPGRPGDPDARMMESGEGSLDLLDAPAALADHGFTTMEMCHFHVPDRSPEYLATLKARREAAGVELWSLLIDDGDLTDPQSGPVAQEWVAGWIDTASHLGARCVRVIAGKQPPTPQSHARAVEALKALTVDAYVRGIRVMTENWFALLPDPAAVGAVLDPLGGSVGLTFDFGNWSGADKYERLAGIAHWAEGCHAKCHFENGQPDAEDFTRCLEITKAAGFSGPYTLVYGEPGAVWESLDRQRDLVTPYL